MAKKMSRKEFIKKAVPFIATGAILTPVIPVKAADKNIIEKLLTMSRTTYTITEDCIFCGACEPECPSEAISEVENKYKINQDSCTACAACVDCCPVDAIVLSNN